MDKELREVIERRAYERGLQDALSIAKGHHDEYLLSCHGPKYDCGHRQASEWIRAGIEKLINGEMTLEQIKRS